MFAWSMAMMGGKVNRSASSAIRLGRLMSATTATFSCARSVGARGALMISITAGAMTVRVDIRKDVAVPCAICGRVIPDVMRHWAQCSNDDVALDRRVRSWPEIVLRRVIICREHYDKERHIRFAGLDKSSWQLVEILPEDVQRGWCKVCMNVGESKPFLRDGSHCSEYCAKRNPE